MYIDLDYYKTDYLGIDPDDDTELTRYITRASDFIDLLTSGAIDDIDDLTTYQQKCVKKATAAFAEYFVTNGDVFAEQNSGSEKVGTWSSGSSNSTSSKKEIMNSTGMAWLAQSGLRSNRVDLNRGNLL